MSEIQEKAFEAQAEPVQDLSCAPSGNGGQALLDANGDFRALRPWRETRYNPVTGLHEDTGRHFIDVTNSQGKDDVQIVGNATLRRNEWELFSSAVQTAAKDEIVGINDLESRGLTMDIGDGMGIFTLTYEERVALQQAYIDMTGEERGDFGGVKYTEKSLPIPMCYSHFRLNMRRLMASQNGSEPLDDVLATEATDNVNFKLEDMLFGSTSFHYGNSTVDTYLTHSARITGSGATNSWDTCDVDKIVEDVRTMKQAQVNKHHRAPWILYVPSTLEKRLDEDYSVSGNSHETLYNRLLRIRGIEDVKMVDRLAAGNALLVEMRKTNVRLVRGMDMNVVQWTAPSGMAAYFQVMTIRVPQIRADANGNLGITHHTW